MAWRRRSRRSFKSQQSAQRAHQSRYPKGSLADWEERFQSLTRLLEEAQAADAAIQSACMPLRIRIGEIVARQATLLRERNDADNSFFYLGWILFPEPEAEKAERRRLAEEHCELERKIYELAGKEKLLRSPYGDHIWQNGFKTHYDLISGEPLDTPYTRDIIRLQAESKELLRQKPTPAEDAAWRQKQAERQQRKERAAQREADKADRVAAKKRKAEAERAAVASALGKAREHADRVKRSLRMDHDCPYCGGELGKQPHADHIYPVSKGGRSVAANMVYVCATCNVNKGDMTLAAFIATYRLDREFIESRLQRLCKDY